MINYIQGEKFWGLADYIYSPSNKLGLDDFNILPHTFEIDDVHNNGGIIYTHTMFVKLLFNEIKNVVTQPIIIITHNSDTIIDFSPPGNVFKWFSQNVNIIHDRIESIPIGLENNRWFTPISKKEKLFAKLNKEKTCRNLVYMNHKIETNSAKRLPVYELLMDKPWVTTRMGTNGVLYEDYIDNIYNHKFVICPEGNGMDTHRVWECLYLNTIPIQIRSINNQYYTDLPICFVDKWEELTEDFLLREYKRISSQRWNLDKLNFNYWKSKILSSRNE
jgi:hypothetical protein